MNLWSIMNWVAWGLSGILFLVMVNDFIRVERGREGGGKP